MFQLSVSASAAADEVEFTTVMRAQCSGGIAGENEALPWSAVQHRVIGAVQRDGSQTSFPQRCSWP
jgi:hypothetical protein